MKKNTAIILSMLICLFTSIYAQEIKIMSFNMQQPYNTNWDGRVANVANIINTHQPDILGSQELHAYMRDQILSRVSGYTAYGSSRECDGSGESSYIFYKTSKYEVDYANSGNFWFKDDYLNCGRGYDPNYNRICSYMRLKDKSTGKYFYVYNSHFPTPDQYTARVKSASLLCQIANNRAIKDPVIFTGDFNSTEVEGNPIAYIKNGSSLKMRDTYRDVNPTGNVTTGFGTRFDFIFMENQSTNSTLSSYVVNSPVASDHLPIVATVKIGTSPVIVTQNIPGKIEAESLNSSAGIQIEPCSEGGSNVGYIDANDWMIYRVNATVSGIYKVELRVASPNNTGIINIEKAGGSPKYGTINVSSSGGWQIWKTISLEITLSAGIQDIAIAAPVGGFNLNWINFYSVPVAGAPIGSYITLKGSNGKFVNSQNGVYAITCNSSVAQSWEKFKVVDAGSGKIALKGSNNQYISSENGTAPMKCNRLNFGGWEMFEWVVVGLNQVALKGDNGLFVSSENGATTGMNCNRPTYGGWEVFTWAVSSMSAMVATDISAENMGSKLYPNPFVENLYYQNSNSAKTIQIFDMAGKLMLQQALTADLNTINTNSLKQGIYISKIQGNSSVETFRILKK